MNTAIKNRPYLLLWLAIPVVLTISVIRGLDKVVDLNIYDTYYIITAFDLGLLISIFLAILDGIYWISRNRKLLKGLTAFHVLTTLLGPLLILLTYWFYNSEISTFDYQKQLELSAKINLILTLTAIFWIASQLAFLFNLA